MPPPFAAWPPSYPRPGNSFICFEANSALGTTVSISSGLFAPANHFLATTLPPSPIRPSKALTLLTNTATAPKAAKSRIPSVSPVASPTVSGDAPLPPVGHALVVTVTVGAIPSFAGDAFTLFHGARSEWLAFANAVTVVLKLSKPKPLDETVPELSIQLASLP